MKEVNESASRLFVPGKETRPGSKEEKRERVDGNTKLEVDRYEVQDPEPDDAGGHSKYKAGASALIPIPRTAEGLPNYPK